MFNNISLTLLCGGQSRRLGRDKALLEPCLPAICALPRRRA